jgi:hypothetical protein
MPHDLTPTATGTEVPESLALASGYQSRASPFRVVGRGFCVTTDFIVTVLVSLDGVLDW